MEKGKDISFNRQEGYRLEGTKTKGSNGLPENNAYSIENKGIKKNGQIQKPAGYGFGNGGYTV